MTYRTRLLGNMTNPRDVKERLVGNEKEMNYDMEIVQDICLLRTDCINEARTQRK